MSTKGWGWAAVGLVAVLAVLVALVARGDGRWGLAPKAPVSPVAGETADRTAAAVAPVEPRQATPSPLPPVGTPLRLSLDELQRRARAGEPTAMCRLAAELSACNRIRDSLDVTGRAFDTQAAWGPDADRDPEGRARWQASMARHAERLLEESRHCDGVPDVDHRELVRQWRAAARAGSLTAMAHYASGSAFPRDALLSLLPELATYRSEAEPMARRLLETGDRRWMLMLAMAYVPEARSSWLLSQVVEPDPVEALALLRLVFPNEVSTQGNPHYIEVTRANLEARLTPAQRDEAARRADALRASVRDPVAGAWHDGRGTDRLVEACTAGTVVP